MTKFFRKRKKRFYVFLVSLIVLAVLVIKNIEYSEFLLTYITNIEEFNNTREENERLKGALDTYEQLTATEYSLEHENEELTSIIEATKDLEDYDPIQATVINRETDTWNESITINKGEDDNIELNMAVLTADGLIGKITKVNDTTSEVTLITSSGNSGTVSAIIQNNSEVSGLVKAQESDEVDLTFEISSDAEIKSGDIIVTSGMGRYPEGIIIGTVTDIEMDTYGLMQIAHLEPSANFDDINYVIVINNNQE